MPSAVDTSAQGCPDAGARRTPRASAADHFVEVAEWADANRIGINAVYEALRREVDPMPHLRIGRKRLVDDELAVKWWRRHYGVGEG